MTRRRDHRLRAFARAVSGAAFVAAVTMLAAGCDSRGGSVRDDSSSRTGARPPEVQPAPPPPARYGVGGAASAAEIAAWDIDVAPDGAGLPAGSGRHSDGAAVYAAKCASCHGARGEGFEANPKLVGRDPRDGFPFGRDPKLVKTVGNYWPYATTLFDYVRRTMPLTAPGSLTDDEVYAVVAFLLAENEVVAKDAVLDARSLAAVRMPARDRFVPDDRRGGSEFR